MNILRFLREQAKNYDCNVCGTNHSRSEISVLGKREGGWVVRVTCSKCQTAITLLVFVGEKPDAPLVKAPERGRTVAARRPRRPAVSLDEVLDAHELLDSYTGDANGLFASRGKVRTSTDPS